MTTVHASSDWAVPARATLPFRATRNANPALHFIAVGLVLSACTLSAIPAGGNNPVMWLFWATFIGFVATIVSLFSPAPLIAVAQKHAVLLALPFCTVLYAFWQALGPVGSIGFDVRGETLSLPASTLSPNQSLITAIRVSSYVLYFTTCLWAFQRPGSVQLITQCIFAGMTMFAIHALAFSPTGNGLSAPHTADFATGTFANHNSFATFMGMGVLLGLGIARSEKNTPTLTLMAALGTTVIAAALFASQSRMGIMATAIATVVFLSTGSGTNKRAALIGLAVTTVIFLAFGQGTISRLFTLAESAETRGALYSQVWQMIMTRPWTGFGAGTFPLAFELFHAPPVTSEFVWDRAHSTYLTLWAELGLIAGSLPLIAGAIVMVRLVKNAAHTAIAALLLCSLHATVDFSQEMPANAFLLLTILAVGLSPNNPGHPPRSLQ